MGRPCVTRREPSTYVQKRTCFTFQQTYSICGLSLQTYISQKLEVSIDVLLGRVKKKIDIAFNHNNQLASGLKRSEVQEQDAVALSCSEKSQPKRYGFIDVLNSEAFSHKRN